MRLVRLHELSICHLSFTGKDAQAVPAPQLPKVPETTQCGDSVQQDEEGSQQCATANLQETQRLENQHSQEKLEKKDKVFHQKLRLGWRKCKSAPRVLFRGSSTVCGSIAYFRPKDDIGDVQSYNSVTEEWCTVPQCPTQNFTLTVVKGLLTAVGGKHSSFPYGCTHTLFSLMKDGAKRRWVEHFLPMPTRRKYAVVFCSGKALVVAGEKTDYLSKLTTVEVMDTDTRQRSTVSSLPYRSL